MQSNSELVKLCIKHQQVLEYIDLNQVAGKSIYLCNICLIQREKNKQKTQYFNDYKNPEQIGIYKIQEIVKILLKVRIQLSNSNESDKSEFKNHYCGKIQEIIEQIYIFDSNVDLQYIKNIIFEDSFERQLILRYEFPIDINITTNLIHLLNNFLVFGTQEGIIHIFDIQKASIIITQKISQFGLVVLVKDPRRPGYFFVSGYEGNIIEFYLQIYQTQDKSIQLIQSINQNHIQLPLQYSSQMSKNYNSNNSQQEQKQQQIQNNNNPSSQSQTKNHQDSNQSETSIVLKRKRMFCSKKQICRMIIYQNGKFLVCGVGKKIIIWNILSGKVFLRLKEYHSSQVYGIEAILYEKYILSISKGTINMFDITKIDNPLVLQKKIYGNQLLTRVKKFSENEFLVMVFPKKISFFKIFEGEQFSQFNNKPSSQNQNLDEAQMNTMQSQQDIQDDHQQLLFSDTKSMKEYSYQQQKSFKKSNKNISIISHKKSQIIETGEITFLPDLAYNINVFDNYFFNISGDYEFSLLINFVKIKNSKVSIIGSENFNAKNKFEGQPRFLQYQKERVLTSIMLENIKIQNKFYKNVLINMPRNSHYEGEEAFPQSLNMCFYA